MKSPKTSDKPIVLAVDTIEEPAAFRLVNFAISNLNKGQKVELVHVRRVQPREYFAAAAELGYDVGQSLKEPIGWAMEETSTKEEAQEHIDVYNFMRNKLAPELAQAGFKVKTSILLTRSDTSSGIADAIIKHANIIHARYMVVTKVCHGKLPLARFFTGSVTREIVARSKRPVCVC